MCSKLHYSCKHQLWCIRSQVTSSCLHGASAPSTASAVARNTAAVVASSISRPASRKADTADAAPRRARVSAREGRVPWRRPSLPRPSRGQEGRGRRRPVHLEARVEEGGYGRRVHPPASAPSTASAVARKAAAVVASFISRPASRRADTADTAPRKARASEGVGTHHMAPAVVASSISRPGRPGLLTPRPSQSCRNW